ncbi:hypothetical protein T484DRAFT_1766554, partial [Baffinella frigidus]
YKFPFALPPFYTAIVRCLGVLEGLAIEVDGRFKIINSAYPYIAGRVLTDPQLQQSLEYMVMTKEKRIRWARLEDLLRSASSTDEWDVLPATNLFVDFIFKEENSHLRYNLVEDVTDLLDTLGLESLDTILAASPIPLPALPGAPPSFTNHDGGLAAPIVD